MIDNWIEGFCYGSVGGICIVLLVWGVLVLIGGY